MRSKFTMILAATLCSLAAGAQTPDSFAGHVAHCLDALDFSGAEAAVRKWGSADPGSPDLVCAKADLYFTKSFEHERNIPGGVPDGCTSFEDDEGGRHYVYCGIVYDADGIDSALKCLADGVKAFPDRLDMRCSMIHLFFVAGRNEDVVDAASAVLDRSRTNGFEWHGRLDAPVGEARICVADAVNGYVSMLKENGAAVQAAALSRRIGTMEMLK